MSSPEQNYFFRFAMRYSVVNKIEQFLKQNITITYLLVFSFKTYSSFEIASCHVRLTLLAMESLLLGIGDSSTCIILLNDSGSNKFCKYVHTKGQLISKCPFDVIIWTKIPTKKLEDFCPSL